MELRKPLANKLHEYSCRRTTYAPFFATLLGSLLQSQRGNGHNGAGRNQLRDFLGVPCRLHRL